MIKVLSLGSAGSAVGLHLITGGTNATPIVATFAANNGLKSGDRVAISGITGLTAMNGEWELEFVTATTFKLIGSVGNGTYGGTPRCALIFDKTPLMKLHTAELQLAGNLVGTLLLEAFNSYAEFAAGDNSLGGAVKAPVKAASLPGITNVNATSASLVTIASSSIVVAATMAALPMEVELPRYLRVSCSAYTSGTVTGALKA